MAHSINLTSWFQYPTDPTYRGDAPFGDDNRFATAPFSVWDVETQSSPTTYLAATDTEINTAAATAAMTPSEDHLIEVTSPTLTNVNGDIRFINLAGFDTAGGSLIIRYTGAGHCEYDGAVLATGTSGGIKFENFRFSREVDGWINQNLNRESGATMRPHSSGAFVLQNCQGGCHWGANAANYQAHPTFIYGVGGGSLLIKQCEIRDIATGVSGNNIGDVHIIESFIDGNWIDKTYFQNSSATTNRVWIYDTCGGYPYGGTATLMLTNEPFQLGEVVHQDNTGAGGNLIVGTVSRIVLPTDPGADPTSFIATWTGNLVWLEMDPVDGGKLVDNVAVVGQTSGASFTPLQTDTSGNSGPWDAGYPAVGFHNDSLQWGTGADSASASYEFYLDGYFCVTGEPVQDVDQGFFTDNQTPADTKVYMRQCQMGVSAVNGFVTNTKDTDIDYVSLYQSPFGKSIPDKFSMPLVGWQNKPIFRFQSNPKSLEATPSIGNLIGGNGIITPQNPVGSCYFDVPADWPELYANNSEALSGVITADGSDETGPNSWPVQFSNFSGVWTPATSMAPAQWVETRPVLDSSDDVKQWLRDNRQPAVGWNDNGWVDPTRYNV